MADENLNKLVEDIERITTKSNSIVPLWDIINCFNGLIDELKGVNKIMQRVEVSENSQNSRLEKLNTPRGRP